MDINKLHNELISEFENRGEFFYIKPSSDKEDLINQFEKFNSQNDDQKQRADTHSLNTYGVTNYDHYHILLNKLRDDEDKLIYKDEEMVNEDYYLYDQEKINAAIKFNMHTIGQVIIYPTKDRHELESLYARYMTLEPNEKCEADEEAKQLFGLDNIEIYNHMKDLLGKESNEVEDTHDPVEPAGTNPIFTNDLPLVTPLELSQKVEENYSCFSESDAEVIKKWRHEYALLGMNIISEDYDIYNLKRINILRKAIHENNEEAIIQCGWIPGIEFNSENRVKASNLIREKMKAINEFKVKDYMPKKCTKCGSENIGTFICGEPIYKCKDCGQYLGTVPRKPKNESYIEEAADNKNLYPVYAVLFSNDTKFGKMIRKVTGSPYSHATVTLDPSLNDMYSFSDIPYNHDYDTSAGFVRESIYSPMYQQNRYFTIYATFTDKAGIDRFNEKLKVFKSNYTNYDYNDIGLVQYFFKMKNTKKHDETKKFKWFCSEFTSYMLYTATGFDEFKNVLQSPGDLENKEDMIEIGRYTLSNFSEKDVIRKTKIAKQEFIKRRDIKAAIGESCIEDIIFEDYVSNNEDMNIILEAKKKKQPVDFVQNEKDVNKYTQIIDWKYLYDEFVKLFKDTDPTIRFDLFEIIIRDYIVPLRLRVDKTADIIVQELKKIYKYITLPFGTITDVDVPERTIKVSTKTKSTLVTYPDFKVKGTESVMESYIEEAKSLPIKIDDDGNLIIKNIRKINFEQEYADSHRLLKEYEKTESYEPMKFELAKMQFFITLLEKRIYKNGKKESPEELKVRARFLNDFKKYLKILNTEDPDFNFREYYEQSQFNDALIKIDKSTLKYGFEALKYTTKSILKG